MSAASPDSIVEEIDITAPPTLVFAALTDVRQLAAWWGKEPSVHLTLFEMDARPGGRWRYRASPAGGVSHGPVGEQLLRNGFDAFEAYGEILEYDPPSLLVWSWIANWHERPTHQTVVRWELTATPAGTRVRVTHSGLAGEGIARRDYGHGWAGVLTLLGAHLAGSRETRLLAPDAPS
jgi:uncharacterized protein YndB with AHSA1/START domain